MRAAVSLMVFVLGLAPYGGQEFRTVNLDERTTIIYDTTIPEPNFERIESLIFLFFLIHENTPKPESIEIHALTYEAFEVELAKNNSSAWHQWLNRYQIDRNTRLMLGFVKLPGFPDEVVMYVHDMGDDTIVHELTHYACHMFAPQVGSGYHKPGYPNDCITTQMTDFMHSLRYRSWLRDRPWANQER